MSPMKLKLCVSSTGAHLWGGFDFGVLSGIIRSVSAPTSSTLSLTWRGREGENEITYGNTGTITFLGGGKIRGHMEGGLCNFDFVGTRVEESLRNVVWSKYVRGWKSEYRNMDARAHDREGIERWGKWGGEAVPERPAESDTTDRGHDSEEGRDHWDDSDADPGFEYVQAL